MRRLLLFTVEKNGAEGGTRTPMGCPTRPSNVRVYQFHHFGMLIDISHESQGKRRGQNQILFYESLPRRVRDCCSIFSWPAVSRIQK
jgi:hypothetical protein